MDNKAKSFSFFHFINYAVMSAKHYVCLVFNFPFLNLLFLLFVESLSVLFWCNVQADMALQWHSDLFQFENIVAGALRRESCLQLKQSVELVFTEYTNWELSMCQDSLKNQPMRCWKGVHPQIRDIYGVSQTFTRASAPVASSLCMCN